MLCFSGDLQSTDSENEPDLNLMTESEKQEYLAKKAKRKAEREQKRKEKYGDKYEEMMEKHKESVTSHYICAGVPCTENFIMHELVYTKNLSEELTMFFFSFTERN